ncbi:Inner membrane protein YqjA [Novipirellula galeiformis]|uniref:Inner membrane protein YqjA n=2 Tax=Novipirellula galeiformis TaxID=2528004 RepID=A0A5C6CT37_9BACT|nr:Inner membrane protein YqjA [Novipirellula galeiformis]
MIPPRKPSKEESEHESSSRSAGIRVAVSNTVLLGQRNALTPASDLPSARKLPRLGGMNQWITQFLEQFGAVGVGFLMLAENLFPPLPSEVVMPWAGYSVSQGDASFIAVVVAGSAGSFAGAMAWYLLARWIGKERLAHWIDRHGVWLTLGRQDLDRVEAWFDDWGSAAVLLCRMIPGLRTLISVPAGFTEMPLGRFSLLTAIGTVIWTALLAGIGWWFGDQYQDLVGPLSWVSTAIVLGLFVGWIWRVVKQTVNRANS